MVNSAQAALRQLQALLGRFAKPELEYQIPWTPNNTLVSPSAIRTDKLISMLQFHWHGRIAIATATVAALPDSLRYLLQEIRVRGTHTQFGAQTPFRMQAKTVSDLNVINRISYEPRDQCAGGAAELATFDGGTVTVANHDLDVFWSVPLFPLPIPLSLAPMYSLKGPDWAGNLYVETDTGDATAFGGLVANTTFSAYGSGAGNPTLYCSVVRPLVTVDVMNRMSPGIPFRTYRVQDSVVQGASFTNQKLSDLNIGKRYTGFYVRSGVLQTGTSAGIRAYASASDAIVTRILASLDGKPLVNPESGFSQQEYDSWLGAQQLEPGYNVYNFIRESGNPDSGFQAETLTSARRFEVDADVTQTANAGCEIVQEEILGTPSFN